MIEIGVAAGDLRLSHECGAGHHPASGNHAHQAQEGHRPGRHRTHVLAVVGDDVVRPLPERRDAAFQCSADRDELRARLLCRTR